MEGADILGMFKAYVCYQQHERWMSRILEYDNHLEVILH